MRLGILGGGIIGSAILAAVLKSATFDKDQVLVQEIDPEKRNRLARQFHCTVTENQETLLNFSDFLVIAIKPQVAKGVLTNLGAGLLADRVILSLMAGVSVAALQDWLGHPQIVRVMPNTPAQIGQGMSVFYADRSIASAKKKWVRRILDAFGICLEVPEEAQIDAATAISGSGPAYLFYLAEQMVQTAQELGFSELDAQCLVQQTLSGATALWKNRNCSPTELRKQVTSPGGTTEAAIQSFDDKAIGSHLQTGMHKAHQRAQELSTIS